jgi:hypothetical protein
MNGIQRLEIGIATKVVVFDENYNERTFQLAIVAEPSWCGDGKEHFGFCYITEDRKFYTDGTYSVGVTNAGISPYSVRLLPKTTRIVTMDLKKIIYITNGLEEAIKVKKAEAVREINALPKMFKTIRFGDKTFEIRRDYDAKYDPSHSSEIQGGLYSVYEDWRWYSVGIGIDRFYRRDGVMLKAKVAKCAYSLIGVNNSTAAIEAVKELWTLLKEANEMVNHIKFEANRID